MNTRDAESGTGRSVLLEHAVGAGPNGSGSAGVWSQDLAYGVDTVRVYSKSQNPPNIPWKPVSKVHPVETRHGTVWVGKWVAHGAGYQMEYSGCYDDHDIPSPRDRHALRGTLICKASLPIILLGHNIWGLGEPDVAAALAIWDERVYEDTGQIRDLMSWPVTMLDVTSDRVLGSEEDVWVVINRLAGMESGAR